MSVKSRRRNLFVSLLNRLGIGSVVSHTGCPQLAPSSPMSSAVSQPCKYKQMLSISAARRGNQYPLRPSQRNPADGAHRCGQSSTSSLWYSCFRFQISYIEISVSIESSTHQSNVNNAIHHGNGRKKKKLEVLITRQLIDIYRYIIHIKMVWIYLFY